LVTDSFGSEVACTVSAENYKKVAPLMTKALDKVTILCEIFAHV
jgi:hypothetical protein